MGPRLLRFLAADRGRGVILIMLMALQKKLYADWGFKLGLSDKRRMRILRHMYRNRPNVHIGDKALIRHFETINHVDDEATFDIGEGTLLWRQSTLMAIGSAKLSIGKRCLIGGGARITARDNITIGDHCLIAWDSTIMDYEGHPIPPTCRRMQIDYMMTEFNEHYGPNDTGLTPEQQEYFAGYWADSNNYPHAPVTVGNNVWIGFGAVLLKGVSIGDNCIIGARSVVVKSIPANCIAAGCPARVVRENYAQDEVEEFWHHPAAHSAETYELEE